MRPDMAPGTTELLKPSRFPRPTLVASLAAGRACCEGGQLVDFEGGAGLQPCKCLLLIPVIPSAA